MIYLTLHFLQRPNVVLTEADKRRTEGGLSLLLLTNVRGVSRETPLPYPPLSMFKLSILIKANVSPGTTKPTPPVNPGTTEPTPPVNPGTTGLTTPANPGATGSTPPVNPGTTGPTPPVNSL